MKWIVTLSLLAIFSLLIFVIYTMPENQKNERVGVVTEVIGCEANFDSSPPDFYVEVRNIKTNAVHYLVLRHYVILGDTIKYQDQYYNKRPLWMIRKHMDP